MQVHYNLLNGRAPDRSRALLTVAPRSASLTPVQTMLLPAPVELACAKTEHGRLCEPERGAPRPRAQVRLGRRLRARPGSSSSAAGARRTRSPSPVSTCDRRIDRADDDPRRRRPHAPARRVDQARAEPGTPRARVLLDIPRWDFHWQNAYTLAKPVEAKPGDVVRVTCRYDVSKRATHGGPVSRRPRATCSGERARPTRCASGSSRSRAGRRALRILLVSQMYPGPDDPDLGVFVANLERELAARGPRARARRRRLARRAERRDTSRSLRDACEAARRFRPDVVYAHFLVPAGLAAALGSRAPLVVTAHGQDVANIGVDPAASARRRATSSAARRR